MMKSLILVLTLNFVGITLYAQFPISSEEMREDFDIFKNSIKEIHPGLYWYADSAEIKRRFNKVESSINHELELKDFYGILQKFYAGIRCGHSWMSMPWKWRSYIDNGPYRIPINFYLEKDRIIVMHNLSNDSSFAAGLEVLSINGIKSKEILDSLIQYTPTDGYAKNRQIRILAGNFSRYYQVQYGMDSIFNLQLKQEGKIKEVELKGLPNDEANQRSIDRYPRKDRSKEPFLYFSELDNEIAYLKIKSFDKEDIKEHNQKYKKFLKRAFKKIDEKNLERLIIDLRGNSGGEDNYGATLASHLIKQPFDYYLRMEATTKKFRYNQYSRQRGFNTMGKLLKKDKNKPGTYTYSFSKQVKKQKPIKNVFEGDVVVLTDGGTFSAASEVASILHANNRATFIGEETGGGYYGNNSAMMYGIQLPNSRINYYLPVIRYYVAVDHPPFIGRGLIPDIQIPLSYKYYTSDKDEILETAIKSFSK
ncbi:S41 family peptidase [Ekhidna sp.]|uniref:S41 family peptidase n=1 Tax=Ekhidna sp. TaxID=2608089 RepID=UPI003BAC2714